MSMIVVAITIEATLSLNAKHGCRGTDNPVDVLKSVGCVTTYREGFRDGQ